MAGKAGVGGEGREEDPGEKVEVRGDVSLGGWVGG